VKRVVMMRMREGLLRRLIIGIGGMLRRGSRLRAGLGHVARDVMYEIFDVSVSTEHEVSRGIHSRCKSR
jgi:hypothetical protein